MYIFLKIRGGFHKSWAQGVKRRAQPNLGKNAKSWAQFANAWCQIRVNLIKKDWRRAQISSIGRKLLYEIHPRSTSFKKTSPEFWSVGSVEYLYKCLIQVLISKPEKYVWYSNHDLNNGHIYLIFRWWK